MLIGVEFRLSKDRSLIETRLDRLRVLISGLSDGKTKTMILYNVTPDGMHKLQQMCVMDGTQFDLIKDGMTLEIPHMLRKYAGRWDARGFTQMIQSQVIPQKVNAELTGVVHFKEADLKQRKVSSYITCALELSIITALAMLLSPIYL